MQKENTNQMKDYDQALANIDWRLADDNVIKFALWVGRHIDVETDSLLLQRSHHRRDDGVTNFDITLYMVNQLKISFFIFWMSFNSRLICNSISIWIMTKYNKMIITELKQSKVKRYIYDV